MCALPLACSFMVNCWLLAKLEHVFVVRSIVSKTVHMLKVIKVVMITLFNFVLSLIHHAYLISMHLILIGPAYISIVILKSFNPIAF